MRDIDKMVIKHQILTENEIEECIKKLKIESDNIDLEKEF